MNAPRILGVVLAGGAARRFGSDKALAELGGQSLIARAVALLDKQCAAVVVAGRSSAPAPVLADRPVAGLGPLGGLNAALHHGAAHGFDAVLSVPVDACNLPADLLGELGEAPACVATSPVIGLWPVAARHALDDFLARAVVHAVRAFAAEIGAAMITLSHIPFNINTPADLAAARDHAYGL